MNVDEIYWCMTVTNHLNSIKSKDKNDIQKGPCLIYVICVYWCPTLIAFCFCFIWLRLVYPMLPVSLDCPFLITPSVFSEVYLYTYMQAKHKRKKCDITFISFPNTVDVIKSIYIQFLTYSWEG